MPTLREERYKEQRTHILLAAKSVFARKGFHDASIKDIMKEASVSNGAIFTYFRTKDAIIAEIIDEKLGLFRQRIDDIVNNADGLKFDEVILALLELVRKISLGPGRAMSLHVWSMSMLDEKIGQHTCAHFENINVSLARLITTFIKRGDLPENLNAKRSAKALFSILIPGYILQLTLCGGMDAKTYLSAHRTLWRD